MNLRYAYIDPIKCNCCHACISVCPVNIIIIPDSSICIPFIFPLENCTDCGTCVKACPQNAISLKWRRRRLDKARVARYDGRECVSID
ncbi:MAG: 4Fe-4S binding protein [Desulfovibrio sp.]|nr:4Fe-4S binding protein [Desulfovibrio sp.]